MKTTIEMPTEYEGQDFDGDWQVTFYFDDLIIHTGVIASNGEQAIRFAEEKLPIQLADFDEVEAKLVGTYGEVNG
jgi:hypothetical protein